MNTTLVELIPMIIGIAIVPIQLIILLMFLKDAKTGLKKGILFLTGIIVTLLLQGVLFGLILDPGASKDAAGGKGFIVSTLLLVLGILMLISAYKKIMKVPDLEDEPPKWIESLNAATNFKALKLGVKITLITPKNWVFILGAIGIISLAQLGQPMSIYTYLVYILLTQILLLITIGIRLLLPKHSITMIATASSWLEKNNRAVLIVVYLIFGAFFFYQGSTGLFLLSH